MEIMKSTGTDLQIEVGDINISYDDFGIGNEALIFIHGFPFDKTTWRGQLEFFSTNRRVLAYDIRGFGKTTTGTKQASIQLFAEDLIGLMDALHIGKAVVCGLSMGGYILMSGVKHYPDRFSGLIFSDTQCVADSPEGKTGRYKAISSIESGGIEAFTDGLISKLFCRETIEQNAKLVQSIRELMLVTPLPTLAAALSALAEREEMCSMLKDISIPTLIICGESDVITPVEQSQLLQKSISGSVLEIIPHAGHLSNLEQPDVFNEMVAGFLADLKS